MNTNQERYTRLAVKRNIKLVYTISLIVALLMTVTSVIGILYRTVIYPTDELLQSFMPNEVVNLFIGVPILLVSMWLTRRGQLIGLLFWPGALLYVLYNYLAYVFALPNSVMFLLYLILVTLSAYTIIGLVASIDGAAVQKRLNGAVPERVAGGILAAFGILFSLRVIVVILGAHLNQTPVATTELGVMIADFWISPTLIIGGVLLWRREALGYLAGLGLLFQSSMLFIGLIFFLLLQPILTAAPFILTDFVVVFIMGLVCFIPTALFVRGVVSNHNSPSA